MFSIDFSKPKSGFSNLGDINPIPTGVRRVNNQRTIFKSSLRLQKTWGGATCLISGTFPPSSSFTASSKGARWFVSLSVHERISGFVSSSCSRFAAGVCVGKSRQNPGIFGFAVPCRSWLTLPASAPRRSLCRAQGLSSRDWNSRPKIFSRFSLTPCT